MEVILVLCCVLLVLSIPAAHLIGAALSSRLDVEPGHVREVMPAMPSSPPVSGKAERRWDKQIRALEKKLIAQFKGGAVDVEAHDIAAQHGVDVVIAEAVLAKMREEIPCRLRITAQGRLIHDFKAEDIQALQSRRQRALPMQILLTILGGFANIGAAWPFLSMIAIAVMTLTAMAGANGSEAQLATGIAGLLGTGAVFFVTFVSGFVMHLFLTPFKKGPRLGDVLKGEKAPQRLRAAPAGHTTGADDGIFWLWAADTHTRSSYSSSSWFDGVGSSGGGGFDLDFDGDDLGGILVVIVVILLLAVIAACLAAVGFWLRGIWRAIKRLDEPQRDLSPTVWVRTMDIIDRWERYIPTNDLVIRAIHAIRRAFAQRRPQDDDLPARALVLAHHHGGRFSALQLALQEGLDLNEAAEVGSRLTGHLGGQIHVSDDGQLIFTFPQDLLRNVVSTPDDDMWAEYITFDAQGQAQRRDTQSEANVPVNLVGLSKGHLQATDRLVAGTYLMTVMGSFATLLFAESAGLPLYAAIPVVLLLAMMALGASTLSSVSRYTSKSLAAQGVMRDIRRAAFKHIKRSLDSGAPRVDMGNLPWHLAKVFGAAYPGLKEEDIQREVLAVCADLDMEPDMEFIANNPDRRHVYDLTELHNKLKMTHQTEAVFDEQGVVFDFENDEVVFDTQIEHDRVSVLGQV